MASVIQDAGLPSEEALELIDFHDLEIEREVGRGTFGVVHKATYFGADVAVKQFKYSLIILSYCYLCYFHCLPAGKVKKKKEKVIYILTGPQKVTLETLRNI